MSPGVEGAPTDTPSDLEMALQMRPQRSPQAAKDVIVASGHSKSLEARQDDARGRETVSKNRKGSHF